jgi:hypothetical protein
VRKGCAVLLLCFSLSGCSNQEAREFTPLPYRESDNVFELAGKTLVNVPAWTLEGALVVAFIGAYAFLQSGYQR